MQECAWEATDDFEAKPLPQIHSEFIRRNHKIELHGSESAGAGMVEGMLTHGTGNASSACMKRRDVSTIGHMRTAATLVGLQEVSAQDLAIFFEDEHFVSLSTPIRPSVCPGNVAWHCISLAGAKHRLK
jgi:hypothetical protein